MAGKNVVIGMIGSTLDLGKGPDRWSKWRPTVSLFQQEDLLINRLELIYQKKFASLMEKVKEDIQSVSPETAVNPVLMEMDDPWDFEEVFGSLHDFAHAYDFNPDEEDYLIHITTGTHVAQICMFLLTESRAFPAKLLQTGPPRRKKKPGSASVGTYQIIDLDLSRYDRIAQRFALTEKDEISFLKSGIDTRNTSFNSLIEEIEHVAVRSNDPILLIGPTGAGKSLLARRIFELKKNRRQVQGEFVEVNCGTLRGDAAMSALFGHRKGAFTGAAQDRAGLMKTADKGILFLDEIGDLGADEQTMLLRALEEKRFLPLGADTEVESDFELIAGTNHDLQKEVEKGNFREDLLARINLWTFSLPGLRGRLEDIEPNLDYELKQFAVKTGRHVTFNREAREKFLRFATSPEAKWAANFRDLNGAVTRMATMAEGGRITVPVAEKEISRLLSGWETRLDTDVPGLEEVLAPEELKKIDLFDRFQLAQVIQVCRESRTLSEAGRTLFSVSRKRKKSINDGDRLKKYLSRFKMDFKQITDL